MSIYNWFWYIPIACVLVLGVVKTGELAAELFMRAALGKNETLLFKAREALEKIGFELLDRVAIINESPLAKQERDNGRA